MMKKTRMLSSLLAGLIGVCLPFAGSAQANDFPSKPINLIVGFPPGGGADVLARTVAPKLEKALGTPIVVENRPGASGVIATAATARANSDGYTLYVATPGSLTMLPSMQETPYDPAEFTAVSLMVTMPNVLVTSAKSEINSVEDLIRKASSGDVNYASGGNGTIGQMAGELFNMLAGVKMRHIPYRGTSPALVDVASGISDVIFSDPSTKALISGGKLKALAVTSLTPSPDFPGVPTLDEAGVKGFEVVNWYGMIGPKGMPEAVVAKLNAALVKIMADEDVVKALAAQGGMTATSSTPEEFAKLMASERAKWADLIKKANIKLE
ncbi:tripartite-type tricarboxylate transporter receptor subunit TctC [Paracandidimonas soli]|uniref:Tripartite-type tricarboxylate transporter receptor subunit TctC n=2 Tax=Paracandidimonas soli TaxID=1917182 RepID=A0A4R3UYR7_9BURK|nr:tripartite-type tricarboxylate transporter receptor subunit TctC [Paracandidimonas soli]